MVAKEFLDYVNQFKFVHANGIYDIFDRCVYILTFSIILVCSACVTVKSYVLDPMSCYVATNVEGANNLAYINNYCWITGTVARKVHDGFQDNDEYWKTLESQKIHYYQWVPLVLGLQAALIYLPYLFWECLIYNSLGTNLQYIIDMARKASLDLGQSRLSKLQRASNHLYVFLTSRRRKQTFFKYSSKVNYEVVLFYFLLKVASLVVILSQFTLMESFLNMTGRHRLFGLSLLQDIVGGHHWSDQGLFPRMGFCRVHFKVQHSPMVSVLAQCSLSVNMLNEKVFIFLWWWFGLVALLQAASVLLWARRCLSPSSRLLFVRRVVRVNNSGDQHDDDLIAKADRELLAVDGLFLVHMVRLNCGDLVCNELVYCLLDTFKADQAKYAPSAVSEGSSKSLFV